MNTGTEKQQNEKGDPLCDFELEKAVLGDCSLDSEYLAAHRAAGVNEECFVLPLNKRVFRELCKLEADGVQFNEANLYESLSKSTLDSLGGDAGLTDMQTRAGMRRAFVEVDVKRLLDLTRRRKKRDAADAYRQALERGGDVEAARRALQELEDASEAGNGTGAMTCAEMVKLAMAELQAAMKADGLTGPPTGFQSLDKLTGGLQHGHYYVAGARPGVGKTALALNIALAVAKAGKRVLFLTAEMTPAQLGERLIGIEGQVNMREFRTPGHKPSKGAHRRAYTACQTLKALHIKPRDVSGWSVEQVADAVRLEHRREPLALVIVDYLGLLKCDSLPAQATQFDTITEVTKGLCKVAKRNDVPLLALCQLSRGAGKDEPMLTDLRQSGQIEQDADMVLLLDRPEKRMPAGDDRDKVKGEAKLIVAKNRHGEAGMEISMRFIGEYQTFIEKVEPTTEKQDI